MKQLSQMTEDILEKLSVLIQARYSHKQEQGKNKSNNEHKYNLILVNGKQKPWT